MTIDAHETLPPGGLLPQSECFVFLEEDPGHTPASAYSEYCQRREVAGLQHPLFYASTTITSGGFRRDEEMPIGEAISANTDIARRVVDEGLLRGGLDPALVVLPSELGKVPEWKQTDYLQFWLYIIRAVDPGAAYQLEDEWFKDSNKNLVSIGEKMESSAAHEERQNAYIDFVREFQAMLTDPVTQGLLTPRWPAPVVIPIFDNDMSLGCSAEYYFACTVLPNWFLSPQTEELQQAVANFIGKGAMVAGVTADDAERRRESNATAWEAYHASELY